ncbi:MAG: amidohydrolase family protein [Planctomycetota bacterium]|nr:amidohydrolase family protein [Planctomycetota bacterium]
MHHLSPDFLPAITDGTLLRLDADAVVDAQSVCAAPGSLLLSLAPAREPRYASWPRAVMRVLAAGSSEEVDARAAALHLRDVRRVRVHATLTPAYVNAHTHLDLTHIGPTPHDPGLGFGPFVKLVVRNRRQDDASIGESVRRGIALSLAGGVVAIGDICGATRAGPTAAALYALRNAPVLGVGYIEYFGIGKGETWALDAMRALLARLEREGLLPGSPANHAARHDGRVRVGIQPHAPYSVSLRGYDFAVEASQRYSVPLCTHLAETPEERRFIAQGDGPKRTMLEEIGIWDESALEFIGRGKTPVAHLEAHLARARMLSVHLNDLSDADIAVLARHGATAAYCPRSSEYFGNHEHFGPHRYRDLMRAGVPVALGTDSVINLPPEAGTDLVGMSTLDEARRLYARDAADPRDLLAMITTHGASVLGLDTSAFTFAADAPLAGLVGIEHDPRHASLDPANAARNIMSSRSRPRLLMLGV